METSIIQVVEILIKSLVDNPDEVRIIENEGERTTIFEAHVAKDDIGKVIGRNGRTIESLRTIIGACGAKKKTRCIFQIIDDAE